MNAHGDDLEAMRRDRKLNPMQHTSAARALDASLHARACPSSLQQLTSFSSATDPAQHGQVVSRVPEARGGR